MRTHLSLTTVAVAATLVLAACGSSSPGTTAARTTTTTSAGATTSTAAPTTTVAATSTTAPATTTTAPATTTTAPSHEQPTTAIWPFATGSTRFSDPVAAARSFATDYVGFTHPLVGAFQQGDTRSGEVPVRSTAGGAVTTVLVRQVTTDGTWWVIGASTHDLQLATPAALAHVSSPVHLTGQSTAFEATVNVDIRQDGSMHPLVQTVVMGGSMGQMGPFDKSVAFPTPAAHAGAIVLKTLSAKDGSVVAASVVRIAFGG